MITPELLSTLLYAIATGYPDRAKSLVHTSEELNDAERERLRSILDDNDATSVDQARRVGDALRELGTDVNLANECYRLAFYLGDDNAELAANPLFAYFSAHRSGRLLDKWVHYFPIYDRHLTRYRERGPKLLEIGVYQGGSLDMWARYLGASATLVGLDIDEAAVRLADPRFTVLIGDQADADFLRSVIRRHGPFDIIIDDGGHTMDQQIASIETLFPSVTEGGVYLVEDCHTSYWEAYGGGRGREGTFIEWVKQRIDDLHGYHLATPAEAWTDQVDAIHCYDSVVVLDKKRRFAPFCEQAGTSDFLYHQRPMSVLVGEMLATRDAAVAERDRTAQSHEEERHKRERADAELKVARNDLLEAWEQLNSMRRTTSWRVTAPMRLMKRRLRGSP